jgi:hypothetical protein
MSTRPTFAVLLVLLVAALAACETPRLSGATTFEEAVRTYSAADDPKVLALAADERGKRAWGAQFGRSTSKERAFRDAIAECDASARRLGVDAQCFLFAVGNEQARSTVEKCRAGRIPPQRCQAQERFAPLLEP